MTGNTANPSLRRGDLLATTALSVCAMLLVNPAVAQKAPNARPLGGTVVAGQAGISQTANATNVTQTSQRAAIDWTSYDIGSAHTVTYAQPNASSVVLNRVTGPDPSQIAGRINANGQVVIVNGSGVVFHAGSQVNAQSLVVSSADVTNQHFMAGQMLFDRPGNAHATISNAGEINVQATGLAALVAPAVINSGVINARLGHVVLAGAPTATVDLYGDGLLNLDVTRQVRTTSTGKTALVTNTGTILADGGSIVLSARAADGLVQTLMSKNGVSNSGRLQANSVGAAAGRIVMSAIGGSITVEGDVTANGGAPAGKGGTIALNATGAVAVQAGARISANGAGGGGTVALGTNARASSAHTHPAQQVVVAAGATISADGTGHGSGGTVALLATGSTGMAGRISARGGAKGGNGGQVEISSRSTVSVTGSVDTTAPAGKTGVLRLDPDELDIGTGPVTSNPTHPTPDGTNVTATGTQSVSAADFNSLAASNNISLGATSAITLGGATALTGAYDITLTGGVAAVINVGVSLTTTGNLVLAGGSGAGGAVNVSAPIAGSSVTLSGQTISLNATGSVTGAAWVTLSGGAASLDGPINAGSQLSVALGSLRQSSSGVITAAQLSGSTSGTVDLAAATNAIGALGTFTNRSGDFALNNGATALSFSGPVDVGAYTLRLTAGGLSQTSAGAITAGTLAGSSFGAVDLTTATNAIGSLGTVTNTGGDFALNDGATSLSVAGPVDVGGHTLSLTAGSLSQTASGAISAGTLTGSTGGAVELTAAANAIGSLGTVTNTGGDFALNDGATSLSVAGPVDVGGHTLSLTAGSLSQTASGVITAGTLAGGSFGAVDLTAATNAIGSLGTVTNTSGDFALNDGATSLSVAGPVDVGGHTLSLAAGSLSQTASGAITAGTLAGGSFGAVELTTATNAIGSLGTVTNTSGDFALNDGATPLSVTGPVDVGGHTLSLAAGSLSQTSSGAISAGTLTGGTGGVVDLTTAANAIAALGPFGNVSGDFSLNDGSHPLSVVGGVNVGAGTLSLVTGHLTQTASGVITAGALTGSTTGAVDLTTATNAIAALGPFTNIAGDVSLNNGVSALGVTGAVNIGAHTLSLVAGSIAQAAGSVITASRLTGSVGNPGDGATSGHDAILNGANLIGTLGNFTAAQGDVQISNNQALMVPAGVAISARDVTLVAGGAAAALNVNGTIGAAAIDAGTAGAVTLSASGALTLAGIVGGERGTTLAGASISVVAGGFVEAGRSGALPLNGTIAVNGALAISGGTLAANQVMVTGTASQTDGTLYADRFAISGPSLQFSNGSVYAGNDLAISVPGGTLAGRVATGGSLAVQGMDIISQAALFAAGNVSVSIGGSFRQVAGQIAAGGSVSIAGSGGNGALGTIVPSASATLAAGTGVELYGVGGGTAAIGGIIAAPSVQVLEPGAALSFQPASLAGSATIVYPGYSVAYHCPVCDGQMPAVSSTAGSVMTIPGVSPATVRLDGDSVGLNVAFSTSSLELHSLGATQQTAPFVAGTLGGTAGYAAVTTAGLPTYATAPSGTAGAGFSLTNAIGAVGPYSVSGGLTVTSVTGLSVNGALVAGGNQAIALTAPAITINDALQFGTETAGVFRPSGMAASSISFSQVALQADAIAIRAPVSPLGGVIAIAPATSGTALTIDASRSTANLSLTPADLMQLQTLGTAGDVGLNGPQVLRLGSLDGVQALAGSIGINAPVTLTNGAATLGLYAQGGIAESGAGGVAIGRQATRLLPAETGRIIGGAGGSVQLGTVLDPAPGNHFDVLGPLSAGAGLSVADAADANSGQSGLLVVGTVASGAGDLALSSVGMVLGGARAGGTIGIGGTLNAVGHTLTLDAVDGPAAGTAITATAGSTILASELTGHARTSDLTGTGDMTGTGASAYDVLLDSSGTNQVFALGGFQVGPVADGVLSPQGAFRLATATDLSVSGTVFARSVALSAGNISVGGAIGAGGDIALISAGTIGLSGTIGGQSSVTLSAAGGTNIAGGTIDAPALSFGATHGGRAALTLASGTVYGNLVSVAGDTVQTGGTLDAARFATAGTTWFSDGSLYAGNDLFISVVAAMPVSPLAGMVSTGGALSLSGTNIASQGTLAAAGAITIADAGRFTQGGGTIAAGQNLTVSAAGVFSQGGGALLAGGTILLRGYGGGSAAISGQVSGGTIAVIEPAAAVGFAPSVAGAATVSIGTLSNSFVCPGCAGTGGAALGALTATPGAARPAALRVDAASLSLGSAVAADQVELHSAGAITQPGGWVQALVLTGTAGYAGSADTLPGYTIDVSTGGPAPVALTSAANNIAGVVNFQVRGDPATAAGLTLVDAPAAQVSSAGVSVLPAGLTLAGSVQAAGGTNLSITTIGPNAGMTLSGTVAGDLVNLVTPGGLLEGSAALLSAGTLTGSASTAALIPAAGNQVVRLGPFATDGAFSIEDAGDLQVVGAVSAGSTLNLRAGGAVSEIGGTLNADTLTLAAGQVTAAGANRINVLAGATTPGGLIFVDTGSLVVSGSVQAASGSIALTAGGALMAQGTMEAGASIRLQAGQKATLAGEATADSIGVTAPVIMLEGGTIGVAGLPQIGRLAAGDIPASTRSGSSGLSLQAGSQVTQTGVTMVQPLPGSADATIRVALTEASGTEDAGTGGAGGVRFAALTAPLANLIVQLGQGTAMGMIDVKNLTVIYQPPSGFLATGSAMLIGRVGGLDGAAAAGRGGIFLQQADGGFVAEPNANYRLNACPIASLTCMVLMPSAPRSTPKLSDLVIGFFGDQDENADLMLPNITDHGL